MQRSNDRWEVEAPEPSEAMKIAETPWSSIATHGSDPMWAELASMDPDHLRALVAEAVEEARAILRLHSGTFDARVSGETMSRVI